jgi:hypothetical protein
MANESEYDDIRDSEDVAHLHRLLKEALEVAHHIRLAHNVPDDIRQAASHIELEAQQSIRFVQSARSLKELKRKPRPTEDRRTGELTKGVIRFTEAVRKEKPEYNSPEFKCIADFDKCKEKRSNKSILCHLALFICMGKRIIPFVRQK